MWTHADAIISTCGQYRYVLSRAWDITKDQLCFCMLNPSTADALQDDPTIRRCINFAHAWGFGSLIVVNLFAYRSRDPSHLKMSYDPIGPHNDSAIYEAVINSDLAIAAWGVHGQYQKREDIVMRLLSEMGCTMYHLGITKGGHPKHPLYLKRDVQPTPYLGVPK